MNRISAAFKSFFALLFTGQLPEDVARAFGYSKTTAAQPAASSARATAPAAPKPQAGPNDGAVQILAILQRDARLVDFLMEDIQRIPTIKSARPCATCTARLANRCSAICNWRRSWTAWKACTSKPKPCPRGRLNWWGMYPRMEKLRVDCCATKDGKRTRWNCPASAPAKWIAGAR